jgi:hypothetical protein
MLVDLRQMSLTPDKKSSNGRSTPTATRQANDGMVTDFGKSAGIGAVKAKPAGDQSAITIIKSKAEAGKTGSSAPDGKEGCNKRPYDEDHPQVR